MKTLVVMLTTIALLALPVAAANQGICGKNGVTRPVQDVPAQPAGSPLLADVEYSTAGALDTPATTGGAADGWGSYFLASWTNTTGADVILAELGWPASGPGPVEWMIWITDVLPGGPGTQTFLGQWTPPVGDPDEFPPSTYAVVDISAENILIPADANIFFGYENPGTGGQIDYNGVDTYAWYEGAWDADSGWGRTALLQLKGNFDTVATEQLTLGQVKTLFR